MITDSDARRGLQNSSKCCCNERQISFHKVWDPKTQTSGQKWINPSNALTNSNRNYYVQNSIKSSPWHYHKYWQNSNIIGVRLVGWGVSTASKALVGISVFWGIDENDYGGGDNVSRHIETGTVYRSAVRYVITRDFVVVSQGLHDGPFPLPAICLWQGCVDTFSDQKQSGPATFCANGNGMMTSVVPGPPKPSWVYSIPVSNTFTTIPRSVHDLLSLAVVPESCGSAVRRMFSSTAYNWWCQSFWCRSISWYVHGASLFEYQKYCCRKLRTTSNGDDCYVVETMFLLPWSKSWSNFEVCYCSRWICCLVSMWHDEFLDNLQARNAGCMSHSMMKIDKKVMVLASVLLAVTSWPETVSERERQHISAPPNPFPYSKHVIVVVVVVALKD